ncbi:MAG TPA: hypothetical protein VF234_00200, partial [Limnochordia bacterium]
MEPLQGTVRVRGGRADRAVPRELFGKFTEHLGRNVYGGAWAQLLVNPELAPIETWPDRNVLVRRLQGAAQEFALLALAGAPARALPPYWAAEGEVTASLQARGGRPLLGLWTRGEARLVTPIFLPLHRTRGYRVTLVGRGSGPLRVVLRRAAGRAPVAAATIPLGSEWTEQTVSLAVAPEAGPPGQPFHLVLEAPAAGTWELRRCLLFPDDHCDGWDADVVRFMREARLPLLRFPGGNFVSAYHWEDGIGPRADRPIRPNPAWPEVEWNHVGTDEWLRLCELVGCEALICVNAGDGTPEEAAAWVEYVNSGAASEGGSRRAINGHPEPYGVRWWEVGNEIYGSWQVGHTDALGYAERYGRFARAMLAADPTIRLIANGESEAWNRSVVAANGSAVRSLSHHCLYGGYPDDADPERVYLEHMAFTPAYGRMWRELVRPLVEAGLPPRLAITEQQVFTRKSHLPTNATLMEAVWTASILNEAIRADGLVELLTHSALVNHGGGLRKEREIVYAQPVWWVTHLYGTAPHPLYRMEVTVESPTFSVEPYVLRTVPDAPYLDAVGLENESGAESVFFLINRHPHRSMAVSLELPAGAPSEAEVTTLSGDSFMATTSWQEPDAVAPTAER